MCEETGRERRGLENKWIYVPLLYHARYLRATIIQLYRRTRSSGFVNLEYILISPNPSDVN